MSSELLTACLHQEQLMAMISLLWKNFCWKLWKEQEQTVRLEIRRWFVNPSVWEWTHLSTLFTFPLLPSPVNPVVSQYVLQSDNHTHKLWLVTFTAARRNTQETLTSLRHRDPPSLKVGLHLKLIWKEGDVHVFIYSSYRVGQNWTRTRLQI